MLCQCSCSNKTIKLVDIYSLKDNRSKSCGCYNKECSISRKTTHGKRKHDLYALWCGIKDRCYNKKRKRYPDWGGRGIKVCDEWKGSFQSFYDWCIHNGWEKGLCIDRKDNNGNYEPDNCRFVTYQESNENQRTITTRNNSGYRGVHYRKDSGSYVASVRCKNKLILNESGFLTAKQAAVVRDMYCIKNNIPLPLNFPELKETK